MIRTELMIVRLLGFSSHYIAAFVNDCGKRKMFKLNSLGRLRSSTWLTLLDGVLVYAEYQDWHHD